MKYDIDPGTVGKPDITYLINQGALVETLGSDGRVYTTHITENVLDRHIREMGGIPGPLSVDDIVLNIDANAHE